MRKSSDVGQEEKRPKQRLSDVHTTHAHASTRVEELVIPPDPSSADLEFALKHLRLVLLAWSRRRARREPTRHSRRLWATGDVRRSVRSFYQATRAPLGDRTGCKPKQTELLTSVFFYVI